MKGAFVTFEGPDGSGKTTVIRLIKDHLESISRKVILTREPGGNGVRISEKIRDILLDNEYEEMDYITEAYLFASSRRQHVQQLILPHLKDNNIVLCDRFIDSSLVYQGEARGIGYEKIMEINKWAIENCMPNLTIILDLDISIASQRMEKAGKKLDRLDKQNRNFHEITRSAYLKLADKYSDRIVVVDASRSIIEVIDNILEILKERNIL